MRPAGPRGGASTPTSRSHAHPTTTTALFATRSAHTSTRADAANRDGCLRHTVGAHLEEAKRDSRGIVAQSHERTMLEATHEAAARSLAQR
jgi:hypothetical protein